MSKGQTVSVYEASRQKYTSEDSLERQEFRKESAQISQLSSIEECLQLASQPLQSKSKVNLFNRIGSMNSPAKMKKITPKLETNDKF